MKQQGACAFSNACGVPGDRVRLHNRKYCPQHARVITGLAIGSDMSIEHGISRAAYVGRPSRQRWSLGIVRAGAWI
jgi:hypothetical protein